MGQLFVALADTASGGQIDDLAKNSGRGNMDASCLFGGTMMSPEELASLIEYLDDYILSHLEAGAPDLPIDGEDADELEKFIAGTFGSGDDGPKFFDECVDAMMKELGLEPPDVYKEALITRDHWSKMMGPDLPRPGKYTVIALAFVFIHADAKKNNPMHMVPEKRMNKLLLSGGGDYYTLKNTSVFDLVIKFCMERKKYSVDDVNAILAYKGQPLLPDGPGGKKNESKK
jgi:hypothetical protein